MLDNMRKKGQPITPKLQEMADWLDGLEAGAAGAEGEVRLCDTKCGALKSPGQCATASPACITRFDWLDSLEGGAAGADGEVRLRDDPSSA